MLDSIRIVNVQRHEDITLEFHPGLNAITGKTDAGKSAIYRAIVWWATNKPYGTDKLMNWGADHMMVEGILSDGNLIRRFRNSKENYYQINDGEKFKGFGTKVPEPIAELLNFNDINFQHQKDQFFLFNSHPSEVAKILQETANLQVIGRSISNAKKEADAASSKIKKLEAESEELETDLEQYSYLKEMEADLEDLEEYQRQVDSIQRKTKGMGLLKNQLSVLENEKKGLEKYRGAGAELEQFTGQIQELNQLQEKLKILTALAESYQRAKKERKQLKGIVGAATELEQLEANLDQVVKLTARRKRAGELKKSHMNLKEEKEELLEELEELKEKWDAKKPACPMENCPLM